MSTLLSPVTLSEKPACSAPEEREYDWASQTRYNDMAVAGGYTSNSVQTFDGHGKPTDSAGDNNDS
ncbi:MAG: hypothetical protein ACYCUV_11750 [Phycisphaerae bacterium]